MTELLKAAIASGQVSAAQIAAHQAAGELPITMFEPPIAQPVPPATSRESFEEYMLTREAPSSAKKKLAMREGVEYLHEHVARHWFTWQQATKAAQPVQPAAVTMSEMTLKDGRRGWYLDLPGIYCDVEQERDGRYTVFFRDQHGVEAYAESAPLAQPVPPAKQQSQPTNIAPCEVLRNYGKCWRNACVVAGACTAQLVQATKP